MSQNKLRIFWIYKGSCEFHKERDYDFDANCDIKRTPEGFYDHVVEQDNIEGGIKVIEHSAYDQIVKECEHFKAQANKLAEALKFECSNKCAIGLNPCKAREALSEWEKCNEPK